MKIVFGHGVSACVILGCLALCPGTSEADSLSATAGFVPFASDAGCFRNLGARMVASCNHTQTLYLPLTIAEAIHDVVINVTVPDLNHNVSCYAVVMFADGVTIAGFTGRRSAAFVGAQSIDLGTVTVPFAGTVYVGCDMQQNSSFNSVNW